jgi:hypothetical protein
MMTLTDFINHYDKDNSIILLEGKRDVLEIDKEKLIKLGELLVSKTTKMLFRSGNADGADYYFSIGVTSIDNSRLQVITPYAGHRSNSNRAYETISLDEINITEESEVVYQSKTNKKTVKLIEKYVSGARDRYSIKAAYIIRDTIKVLGTHDIKPATFGLFYDDLDHPKEGGTGHTINIC